MSDTEFAKLSYNDLRKKCKALGLKASGKKAELVKRLEQNASEEKKSNESTNSKKKKKSPTPTKKRGRTRSSSGGASSEIVTKKRGRSSSQDKKKNKQTPSPSSSKKRGRTRSSSGGASSEVVSSKKVSSSQDKKKKEKTSSPSVSKNRGKKRNRDDEEKPEIETKTSTVPPPPSSSTTTATIPEYSDSEEDEELLNHNDDNNVAPPETCPYLDTIHRNLLDFDLTKQCSVSLKKHNVYMCCVCGVMFQGRGLNTHAYTHSVHSDHHVFINTKTEKFYCLPDNYEIKDASLRDIRNALNPRFDSSCKANMDNNNTLSKSIAGVPYLPGFVGMNNLKCTDYVNATIHALAHVSPLRNHFLDPNNYTKDVHDPVVLYFGELVRLCVCMCVLRCFLISFFFFSLSLSLSSHSSHLPTTYILTRRYAKFGAPPTLRSM